MTSMKPSYRERAQISTDAVLTEYSVPGTSGFLSFMCVCKGITAGVKVSLHVSANGTDYAKLAEVTMGATNTLLQGETVAPIVGDVKLVFDVASVATGSIAVSSYNNVMHRSNRD